MFEVSHKELDNILVQVDQAIDNHDQWYYQLVRTLICKLPPDQRDIDDDAFKLCRFGQWYYNYSSSALRSHPTFAAIENEHKQLHEQVAKLLHVSMSEMRIEPRIYDQFANTLERMRLQLYSLKHEIEGELYNLDPMTGAYTRYGMLATLREQQELVARGAGSCTIGMLDIDHFKQINDRHGHKAGDRMLTHIASTLIRDLRPYDKLFRYGGEEFVLMLPNTPLETALLIGERMRKLIEGSPIEVDKLPIRTTISIGMVLLDPDVSVETSIERADAAMYAAKQAGRNQVRLWDATLALRSEGA